MCKSTTNIQVAEEIANKATSLGLIIEDITDAGTVKIVCAIKSTREEALARVAVFRCWMGDYVTGHYIQQKYSGIEHRLVDYTEYLKCIGEIAMGFLGAKERTSCEA